MQGAAATTEPTRPPVRRWLLRGPAAATWALCSAACALDAGGYARIGTADAGDSERTCYNLGISGGHYRLGNECDIYGELGLAHAGTVDGARYRALMMANYQRPASDGSSARFDLNQFYVEGSGLAGAPAAVTFWLGRRFYGRAEVSCWHRLSHSRWSSALSAWHATHRCLPSCMPMMTRWRRTGRGDRRIKSLPSWSGR